MCCISLIYARMHTYVYPHCSKGEMLYFSVSTKDKYSKYFFYRRQSSPFKALFFCLWGKKKTKKANKIWPMWNPGNIVENTRIHTFQENCSNYNTFVYFWGAWVKGFHLFMRKCALRWERCNGNISLNFCRRKCLTIRWGSIWGERSRYCSAWSSAGCRGVTVILSYADGIAMITAPYWKS